MLAPKSTTSFNLNQIWIAAGFLFSIYISIVHRIYCTINMAAAHNLQSMQKGMCARLQHNIAQTSAHNSNDLVITIDLRLFAPYIYIY